VARKYDHEYKVQAVKLAKEIGGAKAAKELGQYRTEK
jgi:transposase